MLGRQIVAVLARLAAGSTTGASQESTATARHGSAATTAQSLGSAVALSVVHNVNGTLQKLRPAPAGVPSKMQLLSYVDVGSPAAARALLKLRLLPRMVVQQAHRCV